MIGVFGFGPHLHCGASHLPVLFRDSSSKRVVSLHHCGFQTLVLMSRFAANALFQQGVQSLGHACLKAPPSTLANRQVVTSIRVDCGFRVGSFACQWALLRAQGGNTGEGAAFAGSWQGQRKEKRKAKRLGLCKGHALPSASCGQAFTSKTNGPSKTNLNPSARPFYFSRVGIKRKA